MLGDTAITIFCDGAGCDAEIEIEYFDVQVWSVVIPERLALLSWKQYAVDYHRCDACELLADAERAKMLKDPNLVRK